MNQPYRQPPGDQGQDEARPRYQQPNQQQRYVYADTPNAQQNQSASSSFETIHLPILMVVTALLFTTAATYYGTNQFNDLKNAINDLSRKIETNTENMSARITRIEAELQALPATRYTLSDHELWCLKTERINEGWRCGDFSAKKADASPPIWAGQKDQASAWSSQLETMIK